MNMSETIDTLTTNPSGCVNAFHTPLWACVAMMCSSRNEPVDECRVGMPVPTVPANAPPKFGTTKEVPGGRLPTDERAVRAVIPCTVHDINVPGLCTFAKYLEIVIGVGIIVVEEANPFGACTV